MFSARVGDVQKQKNPACFHMPGFQFWRRPIDSLTPDRSPAARAGLTVYLAVPNRSVLCSSRRRQNKTPSTSRDMLGALFWRRPTLARPIAVLPSGLQRFTSVFGMGTGGATALLSPEVRAGLALEPQRQFRCVRSDAGADADLWRLGRLRSIAPT